MSRRSESLELKLFIFFLNVLKVLEEERELSDHDTDLDDSPGLTSGTSWRGARRRKKDEEEEEVPPAVSAGQQAVCHLLAPPLERSGRETPVSVDSIPLEWDHTVDVGGSSSHEDDEDAAFFSTLSGSSRCSLQFSTLQLVNENVAPQCSAATFTIQPRQLFTSSLSTFRLAR